MEITAINYNGNNSIAVIQTLSLIMKFTISIYIIFSFSVALCQQRNLWYNLSNDSDTSFYWNSIQERTEIFNVPKISSDSNDYVWRLWSTSNFIELSKKEGSVSGRVVYMIISVEEKTQGESTVIEYDLGDSTLQEMLIYLDESGINDLPSDTNIQGWRQGLDGRTYIIEHLRGNEYSFKKYWTPSSQNGLMEADLVSGVLTTIDSLFGNEIYEKFKQENPFASYKYYGTSYSIVEIITKKEARKRRKSERRDNRR